jgi:transglutaminase-like putative cysteine protease
MPAQGKLERAFFNLVNFNTYFRLTSYATVAAAAVALFAAGGIGAGLSIAFGILMLVAWKLEGTRWQLSERMALIAIVVSLPVFYLDWQFLPTYLDIQYLETGQRANAEVSVLAHLILFLSLIKLLQSKGDRDWFFLYLITFFEVLLAAGLTVSPKFLASLMLYLLCALSTVVAFEIQKARGKVTATQTRLLVPPDSTLFRKLPMRLWRRRYLETRRLPLVSVGLLILIGVLALPFFLIAPRTASSALKRGGNAVSGFIGFSDNVTLGQIGELKRNDEIFMHVRVEGDGPMPPSGLHWRGVALDQFTGKGWKKSTAAERSEKRESESGFFKLGTTDDVSRLTKQTFFVEPVDTPILFGAPRVLAIQGRLPYVRVDSEGSVQTRPHDQERVAYKVYSDTSEPNAVNLRADRLLYLVESARYLELPDDLDPRIGNLASEVTKQAHATNGYDQARAIESHLRTNYSYSLQMKAGGPDPLSDFLFNVRSGHCEYYATAMAVMLRTQGIASRIVNGFLGGEFNEAAGAYTVRQSDAHSWVEVYFPQTNSWVTFDPTPSAGRSSRERSGLTGYLSKYSEALELMWFQYVVGYDKQEQRSLVTSVRRELFDLRQWSAKRLEQARSILPQIVTPVLIGLLSLSVVLISVVVLRRVRRFGWRRGVKIWQTSSEDETSRVEFYQRLLELLKKQGLMRESSQTPLEFASAAGINEAQAITNAYYRVRYGEEQLTGPERTQIEKLLSRIEHSPKNS